MTKIFIRETARLNEQILLLAGKIEEKLDALTTALTDLNIPLLKALVASDHEIDSDEVAIEEECLKILALHQPVAKDLRTVVTILKVNNDLERVGDIIVNIAGLAVRLRQFDFNPCLVKVHDMCRIAGAMLRDAIESMITLDVNLAVAVIRKDDELDTLNRNVIKFVINEAEHQGVFPRVLFTIYGMARDIERIGDHATNIAEDVLYLVDGRIVRHEKITPDKDPTP